MAEDEDKDPADAGRDDARWFDLITTEVVGIKHRGQAALAVVRSLDPAQEAWFIAACKRCQGTGIGTEEARAAGDNWSAAWDARAAAWEERDAAIKALCAEVSR